MNKQLKLLTVLALLLVSIIPTTVFADHDDELEHIIVNKVEIEGYTMSDTNGTLSPVYAGERVHIKVFWKTNGNFSDAFDAKINVELNDEEQETEFFTVEQGWIGSYSFVFELSNDLEPGVYPVYIDFEDEFGNKEAYPTQLNIEVVSQKHLIEIYDVNFPEGFEVNAGEKFLASVGVKNIGHENEEDVKVTLTIPELGLYQASQKFDLFTENYVKYESDDEDDEYKLYKDLYLTIPSNTVSGVYEVVLKVDYEDGSVEEKYSLVVGAGVAPADNMISIDSETQTFSQGTGAVYTIMFSESNDYTINVEGMESWGTSMIDLTNDQAYLFVSANEDAPAGTHNFKVKVMAGSTVVKEFDLTSEITGYTAINNSDIKEGLQIGFAVLLVILIILGIILAAKKIGKTEDYEESLMDEGETYY
jgi:hypothetical protein|tara:strand:- start:171 stop:1427 length:1257 start_codon:yes stop_codon:yes gene_type:complete